jgi:hypothetical protein
MKGVGDDESGDDENDGDYRPGGSSDKEETDAIKRVMGCKATEYRKILGVEETYTSPTEEKMAILLAYRDLGALTHPDFSNDEKAETASKSKWAFTARP